MPRRVLLALAALAAVVAILSVPAPAAAAAHAHLASASSPAPPGTVPEATDNPFIPPNKDLSACVSAVPQPGCGSKAHGGWHQGIVFVVVVVALAFIGWRIVTLVRRGRRELEASGHGR